MRLQAEGRHGRSCRWTATSRAGARATQRSWTSFAAHSEAAGTVSAGAAAAADSACWIGATMST